MDISEITSELAKKHGISKERAYRIAYAQFSFIRKTIAAKKCETVMIPKLGKFAVKPYRYKMYQLHLLEKERGHGLEDKTTENP